MQDLNFNALIHFEAVARLGRVSKAALELGVSTSAVSQQVRHLEAQMGVRLFRRERRTLYLTDDGERLYRTVSRAIAMVRDVRGAILRQRENRHFILRTSPSFGVRWLAPRLAGFRRAHPGWDLRVDATPDFTAFETENVDMDIRYGAGGWAGFHEEAVVHDFVLPMCSPDYAAHLRSVSDDPLEQLRGADLIESVKTLYRWDFWLARHGLGGERWIFPMRFDRSSMAIQVARDGGGVVLENATLAMSDLAEGALVPLSTAFEVITFPAYWIVCPARHLNRRIVRLFAEWLRDEGARQDVVMRERLTDMGCQFRTEEGPHDRETRSGP